MPDLRTSSEHLGKYLAHLRERESVVPHFYCDSVGLVTVGVGHLVDRRGAVDAVGRGRARVLAKRKDIAFTTAAGVPASVAEVERDWQRAKDYGRKHPKALAKAYRAVAKLRLSKPSIDVLTQGKVSQLCDMLYSKRPFLLSYEAAASMAFVDVLYNPAGVALFGRGAEIVAMWSALDPASSSCDPLRGVQLFERIWANRGTPRYAQRHATRVQWLRAAVAEDLVLV